MKFLDNTGLTYLWTKIKAKFATITYVDEEIEDAAFVGQDDGSGGIIDSETGQQVDISKYALKTWVQGQGYLTSHQDISGKQDTLVSGTNIKTINNQTLLGSGNITIEGGSGSGDTNIIETVKVNGVSLVPDANKAVDVPTLISEINHGTSDTTFTLTPNVYHKWGELTELTISLPTDSNSVLDEFMFEFTSGSTPTTFSYPVSLEWVKELVPEANKTYQVSIQNNLAGYITSDMGFDVGDENVIEVVKVNGTALTPDENKAVDVTVPTEITVSGWGFTKNSGTYSKPSGGIPATDLASAVQTSLGKADTALQSYTETDPTVPSWAKASSKPSYTASEVGAVPTSRTVNGKALSSNISLTASDVGAVDASEVVTIYSGSSTPSSSLGSNGDIYIKTS